MDNIVVFDWGGVLIRGYSKVYAKLAEETGYSTDEIRDILYSRPCVRGEIDHEQWITGVRDKLFPDRDLEEFNYDLCVNYIYRYMVMNEDVFEILNRIKEEKKCPVVALSNTTEVIVWVMLNKFPGLYYSFLRLYLSFQMKCAKPEEKIFLDMIGDLAVNPGSLLFIDDKKENIEAASKLGMGVLHFENAKQLEKALF